MTPGLRGPLQSNLELPNTVGVVSRQVQSHPPWSDERLSPARAFGLDVYARPFFPEQLTAINLSPATILESKSLPEIDFGAYVSGFAGAQFLKSLDPLPPVFPTSQRQPGMSPDNYQECFEIALASEQQSFSLQQMSFNLYQVRLEFQSPSMYLLNIPGLREGTPKIQLGDVVAVRQLRMDQRGILPFMMRDWLLPGHGRDQGHAAPGFTGYQHNARVWAVDRRREKVLLRIDACIPESLLFNVSFLAQEKVGQAKQRAIMTIQKRLKDPWSIQDLECRSSAQPKLVNQPTGQVLYTERRAVDQDLQRVTSPHNANWMRKMLFPAPSDGVPQASLPQGVFHMDWVDQTLNYEQMKAANSVCHKTFGSIPFLISGPPGTGKTKTIVEIALQLVRDHGNPGNSHVLLCAPSDTAADTLASRLISHLDRSELFRLNSPSRSFAEVPDELLPYCHIEDDLFNLPSFFSLMGFKIIVSTCAAADLLVQARVTNADLCRLESGLISALHPAQPSGTKRPPLHWKALLVDEAAQAIEPEVAIALSVVIPPHDPDTDDVLFVMAGDQNQLGPQLSSNNPVLEISLFERLFDREIYKWHPLSRRQYKQTMSNLSQGTNVSMMHPPFSNLFRNYRSHPTILAVPNALFYHDTLIPEAPGFNLLESWSGWKGRHWPVLFCCNAGQDELEAEGGGWYNMGEVEKAYNYALSLYSAGLVEQSQIMVMSPFRAQVYQLRRRFRLGGLYDVNIGPMEVFQGLESRMVIVCTTRTRSRFLAEDLRRRWGFVNEPRRFNVALTRAKQGLIVIGNPWLLSEDPCWSVFMAFCQRHGLWDGDPDGRPLESSTETTNDMKNVNSWKPEHTVPLYISRLETAMLFNEKVLQTSLQGKIPIQDDAMWISGVAAEEALREVS